MKPTTRLLLLLSNAVSVVVIVPVEGNDSNYLITLGIGTPSGIKWFLTGGLGIGAAPLMGPMAAPYAPAASVSLWRALWISFTATMTALWQGFVNSRLVQRVITSRPVLAVEAWIIKAWQWLVAFWAKTKARIVEIWRRIR